MGSKVWLARAATVLVGLSALAWWAACRGSSSGERGDGRVVTLPAPTETAVSERRVALVVGNANYQAGRLRNPLNDARAMADALRAAGFEVEVATDADLSAMQAALQSFGRKLSETKGGVGLFYYSGHGGQVDGRSYMIPLGAEGRVQKPADIGLYCLDVDKVLGQMEDAGGRVNIVILDACRNSPFRSFNRDDLSGLAEIKAPVGTLIAYATAPGRTASDGEGDNSPYVEALLKAMRQPGWDVERVFKAVRAEVRRKTHGRQVPWESTSLEGEFYFCPVNHAPGQAVEPAVEPAASVMSVPAGGRPGEVWESPAGIRLAWVPAGEFEMGEDLADEEDEMGEDETVSDDEEVDLILDDDEELLGSEYDVGPAHQTRITRGFWLGECEVTQAQWLAVMGNNPSEFRDCLQCPVENVSWEDCQAFVRKLNEKYPLNGGWVWRLPYEAEWEYACRAGTQGDYCNGDGARRLRRVGWYFGNSGERTNPVKRLRANGWGLYDMHGNVWEWCEDWYKEDYYRISPKDDPRGPGSGDKRVLRGGSWFSYVASCRAAARARDLPTSSSSLIGLRVAVGAP